MGKKKKAESTKTAEEIQKELERLPYCEKHPDCQSWIEGRCKALVRTYFGKRECPFYKSKSASQQAQLKCLERLVKQGRMDLLGRYRGTLLQSGVYEINDAYMKSVAEELKSYDAECFQELMTETQREDEEDTWDD
jgi:hypothetical protein